MTKPNPVKLDMKTLLPKVRKAFDAGLLQAQDPTNELKQCSYDGPCAIGIGMTPRNRKRMDGCDSVDGSVGPLIVKGHIIVPDGQVHDFVELQDMHDGWVTSPRCYDGKDFSELLCRLEEKYAA